MGVYEGNQGGVVSALAFSPDGKYLVGGDVRPSFLVSPKTQQSQTLMIHTVFRQDPPIRRPGTHRPHYALVRSFGTHQLVRLDGRLGASRLGVIGHSCVRVEHETILGQYPYS